MERQTIPIAMNTEGVDEFLDFLETLPRFAADDPVLVVRRVGQE